MNKPVVFTMSVKKWDKAKEKDKEGKYARIGMETMCSNWFNIEKNNYICVKAIIDDYLETVNMDLFMWLRNGNGQREPVIFKRDYLESNCSDLFKVSDDLQVIADLFLHLYGIKFYVDYECDCIYSTEFKEFTRRKLNYVGIMMEVERLITLQERKVLDWKDIDESVELLKKYGYDINQDESYRTDDLYETSSNILERLDQIFKIENSNVDEE